VALAEVLGNFGRYGVDLASYWPYPPPDSPTGAAFRMYRNVDGDGAVFGDLSIPATSSQKGVEVFAARHSERAETDVMLINETLDTTAHVRLDVDPTMSAPADEYVLAGSSDIQHAALGKPGTLELPALSVSLVRFCAC
jgi:hypothetical protein